MYPVRLLHRLACGALIALAAGCGRHAARVVDPNAGPPHATAIGLSQIRRGHDPHALPPCNPSYTGPVITLFGPGLEYRYPTGGFCPCPETEVPLDVPEHRTATFRWTGDGSEGCAEFHASRWALDIVDVYDNTPRIDENTDLSHWSAPSVNTSATLGPFTFSATGSNVHRLYVVVMDNAGYLSLGIVRINVVPAVNRPPDVQSVAADLAETGAPNGRFSRVVIGGVTDPDGDAVTITVTGVTQDEPLLGHGDHTCPDAAIDAGGASVRRERSAQGNGRVYTIAFTADDGNGGVTQGTAEICIPRNGWRNAGCVEDALVVNSLESCEVVGLTP